MIKKRKKYNVLRIFNLGKVINKTIIVLIVLLSVLISKTINSKITSNVVNKIEKGIYYDFSFREDGKKIKDYVKKTVSGSKDKLEQITLQIYENIKPGN